MTTFDNSKIYLTSPAVITPLGDTAETFFQALLSGRHGFSGPLHFEAHGRRLGVCHQIDDHEDFDERFSKEEHALLPPRIPRAHRLLNALRAKLPEKLPKRLYLATTVGDIDLVTAGGIPEPDSPQSLLAYAKQLFEADEALLVSSACASGQRAICLAADAVVRGEIASALVVGCDQTSEFVTSGFGSLNALTAELPKPYDVNRSGMALGEAAAAVIVTDEMPAGGLSARLVGYGESCDAAHITAPDASGTWLAEAIRKAMPEGLSPNAVIGHGTGTIYNDQAELNALQIAFLGHRIPLFSLKGNIGHTLGATGVLQAIAGMEILATRQFPPQAGLDTPAQGAEHAVATTSRQLPPDTHTVLSLNAGFGGLNNALLLTDLDIPLPGESPIAKTLPIPELLDIECDTTAEERLAEERDALVARGVLSAEDTADFRRASLAVKHAILAAAKLKERMGNTWCPEEITIIGFGGDGVRHSNPAYWKDYIDHGRRRGRGTLFVDTLASIPLCEVAIALQLHGPAGYLQGKSQDELFPPHQIDLTEAQLDCIAANRDLRLRTSKTRLTLLISAYAEFATAVLFGIARQ
ncbi:MAG: hypothetical protein IKR13_01805 [Victivallales bacterium]|nr:hypothetical protein [Victivallales bacterium]